MIINKYMMSAKPIQIETPDKLLLDGFIFRGRNKELIYIFIHGLGGNLFSRMELIEKIVASGASAMAFNNRGSGLFNRFRKINKRSLKGYDSFMAGSSAEVFKDSFQDIKGAVNLAKKEKYKKIILVGHSTGSNKVAYYLSKINDDLVKGGILLAPMSDCAFVKKQTNLRILNKATKKAKDMVVAGKSHDFLPFKLWPYLITAQRFLSLFTSISLEEVFSYRESKKSKVLGLIKKPLLVILAQNDEFADREMLEIFTWFQDNLPKNARLISIVDAFHSFSGKTNVLKKHILNWSKDL